MNVALHTIECFAGVGMLGIGLCTGLGHLGIETRTVCYVEREAFAASVMAARMAEGALDDAPVWTDVTTFDAHAWRGAVDCVIGGFPCQDLSLAGRRAGLDGKRSGLFFDLLRIAEDSGARYLFLENVAGIASATATVVDEAEGALDERAAARVLGELADRGWDAEWLTLSASDVGASHGRERWFCWAWRELDDAIGLGWGARRLSDGCDDRNVVDAAGSLCLGHTGLQHQHLQQRQDGAEHPGTSGLMECEFCGYEFPESCGRYGCPNCEGDGLADPEGDGWDEGRPESGGEQGRSDVAECGCAVADANIQPTGRHCGSACGAQAEIHGTNPCNSDRPEHGCAAMAHTSSPRQQGRELGTTRTGHRGGAQAHGPVEQLRRPFFAPGPADARWPAILREWPGLAPALDKTAESGLRRVADGLADRSHDCRAQRLKCVGNGVVALCAAAAVVQLVQRMKGANP